MIVRKQIKNEEKTMVLDNRLKFQNLTPTASVEKNEFKNYCLKSNNILDFP